MSHETTLARVVGAACVIAGFAGGHPARAQTPGATLTDDTVHHEFVIAVARADLPVAGHEHAMGGEAGMKGHEAHQPVFPPIGTVTIPFDVYLHGFSVEVVDADGRALTPRILHHMNLIMADRRELFLPISQRLLAVGSETGAQSVPGDLIGVPVPKGQRLVVAAMLHNPTGKPHKGVQVRLHLQYERTRPAFAVYPYQIDVGFPAGDKDVDLPPGHSTFSWQGSPSVPGRILVIGGHLHDYGTELTLTDVTADSLLWSGEPILDDAGKLVGVTVDVLDDESAIRLVPDHTYRVTVTYDNPTADTLYSGGMGVIAGVFDADSGVTWPAADPTAPLYRLDRMHYMREVRGRYADIAHLVDGTPPVRKP